MFDIQILLPYNSYAADYVQKESVELIFVYQVRGSDKTLNQINDAIPHTWIDMEYRGAYKVHLAHSLHKK